MKLRYYVTRRLILLIPVLIGVSVVMFTISHVIPSAPAHLIAGPHATEKMIEEINRELGLDQPLYVQYYIYIRNLLSGDMGWSIHERRAVLAGITDYFPATFELTTAAILLTTILGIPLGVVSATKRDRLPDHASRLFSLVGISMPVFWLGLILQLVFGNVLGWLPVSGRLSTEVSIHHPITRITGLYTLDSLLTGNWVAFQDSVIHLILPVVTLTLWLLAVVARMARSSMLEVLRQDYIRNARSDGLPNRTVIYKYALRNALIPTTTIIGITYGLLLGGDILVESIFSWPGMGLYAVKSIVTLDFAAVVGVSIVVATVFVLVNLIVDIIYGLIDPRIRYG